MTDEETPRRELQERENDAEKRDPLDVALALLRDAFKNRRRRRRKF